MCAFKRKKLKYSIKETQEGRKRKLLSFLKKMLLTITKRISN